MKKKIFSVVLVLGYISQAVASDWVKIGYGDDFATFGDVSSRTRDRAWFETRYTKPQKLSNGKFYMSEKQLFEFSCNDKSYRTLTMVWYSRLGMQVDSDTLSHTREYIIPDTRGEVMYDFVCFHSPR